MRLFLGLFFIIIMSSCSSAIRYSSGDVKLTKSGNASSANVGTIFYGKASFYADKFEGRLTANGETFSQNEMTCAHKTLPFNTKLKIVNLNNNKTIIVRVNDRGPFIAGRVIDLSKVAAQKLDMINDGVIEVKCEIIQ